MNFLASILPADIDSWTIKNGIMTTEKTVLRAGGSVKCTLTNSNIAYIPDAFQIRVRHDADVNWKNPDVYVTLQIEYEDGSELHTLVPLNTDNVTAAGNMTVNVSYVESKTFNEMLFTIHNNSDQEVTINLHELRPSQAMSDSLYNAIDSLLPQLVYAYNTSEVVTKAGIETQILQLPVSVGEATNLLVHITVSGTTVGDTLTCTLKLDGEVVRTFPVKQVAPSGDFYFGIPSIIPFIKVGAHLATLHISADSSSVTIPLNKALLTLDGKGVLGGASGEYPHAEVVQEIHLEAAEILLLDSSVSIGQVDPPEHSVVTRIPMSSRGISSTVSYYFMYLGKSFDMYSDNNEVPPIIPYDPEVYYTNFYGMRTKMAWTFSPTVEVRTGHTVVTTKVDTTKFNPVYTKTLKEVRV